MRNMDWIDIMLHVAAAVVLTGLLSMFVAPIAAVIINALFFVEREVIQDLNKGNNPPWPIRFSSQKWAEIVAPVVAGILAAGIIGGVTHASAKTSVFWGKVVKVMDGDTVRVETDDGRLATIRMVDIDAPEKRQPGGLLAAHVLKELIEGKRVQVMSRGTDKYGRFLARVWSGMTDANIFMVCNGYAWAAAPYKPLQDAVRCEKMAREEKRGIWAYRIKHEEPWKWRKRKREGRLCK